MMTDFLKANGFLLTREDQLKVMQAFETEAGAALAGSGSSLRMIDSLLSPRTFSAAAVARPVIVVDAGGTNLRVAAVRLTEKGARFSSVRKSAMPGSKGWLSADAFHRAIAAEVDAVRAAEPEAAAIGYCFSYECQSLPDHDARLVAWSKQIDVPDVVGQKVGAELVRRLSGGPLPVVVLNDTVATLLAGQSMGSTANHGQIGFILGTGTNLASIEDGTIRNAESGECDKVPQTQVDRVFDATLPDTGAARFEKMVAGAYLGDVGLHLMNRAIQVGLLESKCFSQLKSLTTRDLDSFAVGDIGEGNALRGVFSGEQEISARELARAVFVRAASLTAAHLAAFILRSALAGRVPVRVTADGSTYWKVRAIDFNETVRREISGLLPDIPFEIVAIDDAPMVGAAVAAVCSVS